MDNLYILWAPPVLYAFEGLVVDVIGRDGLLLAIDYEFIDVIMVLFALVYKL